MEKKFKRTTVTSALPYANGPVHIGHLAGVYVPADIYVRYLRLKKEEVLFIGGSDEHGVPITIRAKKEGITPQDVVDRYHTLIKDSFKEFGISFDVYSRTTSATHREVASDFFRKLYDKGEFIEKTSMQYYDEEAKQFLADRYITGECPHCHAEGAYGDQCEKCGTSLSPTDLINPKSAISGSQPVMKETKHWYLPLDKHEGWLRQWILEDHKEWRPNVYGQCKSWLDMGLQPRAVSRDLDWGIPVPVEGAEGKVLYVWFDAPIGYISNTKELLPDTWETWWKDPETRLVHFIGKDNIVVHCIVFPAMLEAEGSYRPGQIYEQNPSLRRALEHLIDGSLSDCSAGEFSDIYHSLLFGQNFEPADRYYLLLDFAPYQRIYMQVMDDYVDRSRWQQRAAMNTACAGYFSSDRTIAEYNSLIWQLQSVCP